jgi:ribosome recycling factor
MNNERMSAYAGRKRVGRNSIIKFNVNNTYEVPVSLLTTDISQFQTALDFSAKLIDLQQSLSDDFIKSSVYQDYIKSIETKHNQDILTVEKNASDNFNSRLSDIIQTITDKQRDFNEQIASIRKDYDNQIKSLLKEKKVVEDDATATKQDLENSFQKELRNLKKQLAEKDSEVRLLSKGESLIREQCNLEFQKILSLVEDKNAQAIDAMRKSYEQAVILKEEALQFREDKISQREQELQTLIQRNASSSYRGQDGETYFQSLAEEKMKWTLIDTSKIPHSCDYSSTIHNINVLFEMKNYTSDIRTDEVTKFLRDMKEHSDVPVGVFISLNTRITGKDKDKPISIEWINDSQCAVYIQTFKELDEIHTLSLIDQIIKLSATYNKMIYSKGDLSEESMLQGRIDKARVYIEEYITETCSLIKRVTNDQKLHRQLVESSYSHTLSVLKTQSRTISTALEIITGEYKEDNTIDETLIDTADEVKPKKVGKKKV